MEERARGVTEKEQEMQAEAQSLLLQLRQYQAQAEAITQELSFVGQALAEHDKAIETIKQLKNLKVGDELMVPIGANSLIYVSVSNIDTILVQIGGGISAEKDPDSSIVFLTEKKTQLEGTQREMAGALQKMEQEAQKSQARLQELTSGPGGQG